MRLHSRGRQSPVTHGEAGATAVEYALIVGLIAVVIAAGAALLGTATAGTFETFNSTFADCTDADGC